MFRNIADTDCYTKGKVRCNCRSCKTNKTDFFSFLNVITKPMKIKQKAWMFHAPSIKHPFHTAQSRINPQLWVRAYSIFVVKHPGVPAPKQIPKTSQTWHFLEVRPQTRRFLGTRPQTRPPGPAGSPGATRAPDRPLSRSRANFPVRKRPAPRCGRDILQPEQPSS